MKMLRFLLLLIIIFLSLSEVRSQSSSNADAIEVLKKFSAKYQALTHIAYHANYSYVNSEMNDSVFTTSGWVWVQFKTEDSIFGSYFHVKGESRSGNFDYFYDGTKGYEGYHNTRKATIVNPYTYANNANNPAKARTSLRIFNSLLTQRNIADYLLNKYPYAQNPKVVIQQQGNDWLLQLDYPANPAGALISFEIAIAQNDLRLKSSKRTTLWNGTRHTELFEIDSIDTDITRIQENIPLTTSWEGYSINEPGKRSTMTLASGNWEGQMSPEFSYPLFGNGQLALKDLKGSYVVLDFWETWCGYCILAIPKLNDSYRKYKSKGVEFVGITTENSQGVERIIRNNKITYPQLKADKKIVNEFGFEARPAYVLLDKTGKVIIFNDWDRIEKFLDQLK